MTPNPADPNFAFSNHPRRWRDFRYVYPVISRRSKGLSIGINLNPGQNCNLDCIYCQVNRLQPGKPEPVDFAVLSAELRQMLQCYPEIFQEEQNRNIPPEYRVIRDIAFSGDGEPTLAPAFPAAAGLAAEMRSRFDLHNAKIVVITNSCFLRKPTVIQTLAFLDDHNGEIWAKLDAGTQAYFEQVNAARHSLDEITRDLHATCRVRPIVIQSLFMRIDGQLPPDAEITAYLNRLRTLTQEGGQIKLVQVYTLARKPAQSNVEKLTRDELEKIVSRVRELNIPVELFL